MLKQRVLTAVALAAGFIAILFFSPWWAFALAVGLVLILGAWEWSYLSGIAAGLLRYAYCAALVAIALLMGFVSNWATDADILRNILLAACIWWGVALLWVQGFPASAVLWSSVPVRLVMGMFVLVPAWVACLYLRIQDSGAWMIFFVVLLVAAADIGAYFSGKALGKRKLAPAVSPGKSWEGVVGGALTAALVAVLFNIVFAGGFWGSLFAIVVPTALISVLGDLLESMMKRQRGVKDSSQLLPGHGGVLDRIDGLVAALPVFALAFLSSSWRI